ncbi:unnamed protein product [Triticum turgidum subsp. durum]|uniref:Cullin N-terminal domain-containing protein n=1 Tax=Triticum turgidum subsp. durum TaxID=4567 RepID=A0A9R0PZE7_TRITD|nr:unnamed protein product [Triticum turgidum subsp. durum]
MTTHERKTVDLEEGWAFMQKGITKLKNILEGKPEPQFSSEDYMMLYTTIYNMCTQKPPHDYSQQLYDKYRESFEEYISSMVSSRVFRVLIVGLVRVMMILFTSVRHIETE